MARRGSIEPRVRFHAFPELLPGEILMSGIIRYGVLNNDQAPSRILRGLVGETGIRRSAILVPGFVQAFCDALPGHHPQKDPLHMVQEHTGVPYLLYFRPELFDRVLDTMLEGRTCNTLTLTGLSQMSANQPERRLVHCRSCAADDERAGVPYWHREHQLPGVFVCPKHEEPLVEGCAFCSLRGSTDWRFPLPRSTECPLHPGPLPVIAQPDVPRDVLVRIARQSSYMCNSVGGFQSDWWALIRPALVASAPYLQRGITGARLEGLLSSAFGARIFERLGLGRLQTHRQGAEQLFRHQWRARHPIRPLLISLLVAEDLATLEARMAQHPPAAHSIDNLHWTPERFRVIPDLVSAGMTVSELARYLGIEKRQAAFRVRHLGLCAKTAFKTARGIDDGKLREMIKAGADFGELYQRLHISRSQVVERLKSSPLLSEVEANQFRVSREKHRAAIIATLSEKACKTRTALWKQSLDACLWLNRYDRPWLESVIPPHKIPGRAESAKPEDTARWEDALFEERVRASAKRLLAQLPPIRASAYQILSQADLAVRFRKNRQRYPRTSGVLAQLHESARAFARRRLASVVDDLAKTDRLITPGRVRGRSTLTPPQLRLLPEICEERGAVWSCHEVSDSSPTPFRKSSH